MGLEAAGFDPVALFERNRHACAALRANRLGWRVLEMDLRDFVGQEHRYAYDVDLIAAGLPRVKSYAATSAPRTATSRNCSRRPYGWSRKYGQGLY
ncbi:hypothetical protein [Streptomyces natalensis]|uniref:hypothetical protein n=1 Tax=Streptomyces natalensis TaxID=68242 RepID=UPI0023AA1C42|nr:hypothetical protein [Streptomyces natalensis]